MPDLFLPRACNGYDSTGLAEMLEIIMQHWDRFAAPLIPGPSSIQIKLPTQQETLEANGCMRQAYKSLGRTLLCGDTPQSVNAVF